VLSFRGSAACCCQEEGKRRQGFKYRRDLCRCLLSLCCALIAGRDLLPAFKSTCLYTCTCKELHTHTQTHTHSHTYTHTCTPCHLLFTIFRYVVNAGGFCASGFKRAFKMKDFGDTIPGHGGVTDRFDCQVGGRFCACECV